MKKEKTILVLTVAALALSMPCIAQATSLNEGSGITIDQSSTTKKLTMVGKLSPETGIYTDTSGLSPAVETDAIAKKNKLVLKSDMVSPAAALAEIAPAAGSPQQVTVQPAMPKLTTAVQVPASVQQQQPQQQTVSVPAAATTSVAAQIPAQQATMPQTMTVHTTITVQQPPQMQQQQTMAAPVAAQAPVAAPAPRDKFAEYDKNQDGSVSRDEFLVSEFNVFSDKAFESLDRDGNNSLDRQEFAGRVAPRYQDSENALAAR